MNLEQFAHCCGVQVCSNDGHTELRVFCGFRDPETGEPRLLRRTVDLDPLAQRVHEILVDYHNQLHGGQPSISGWKDLVKRAKSVAKRIGESLAVRSLYREVAPLLESVPGGKAALKVAHRAHDILTKSREGSRKALAKLAVIRQAAVQGDAQAYAIMKLMKSMDEKLDAKEAVVGGPISPYGPFVRPRRRRRRGKGRARGLPPPSRAGTGTRRPTRPAAPAMPATAEETPYEDYQQYGPEYGPVYEQPQYGPEYEPSYEPSYEDDPYRELRSEEVSGWAYGRYQRLPDVLLHPSKSPALAMRELYHRGLGQAPTRGRDVAFRAIRSRLGV